LLLLNFEENKKMQTIFKKGDTKTFKKIVQQNEIASFETGMVHEVYSTFSIAKDAEWSGRLFVLEMKEEGEEGIGTHIHVNHQSPAFVGDEIVFVATFVEVTDKGEIVNTFEAQCNDRIIATGQQGQRILKKDKIDSIFKKFKN
jgi:fluoroacetyl-CoA thioesterase